MKGDNSFSFLLIGACVPCWRQISMGSELGCLSGEGKIVNGRYTLPQVEFAVAFDMINNICAKRQGNPLWEITEKLDGTKAKVKWCQQTLDGFSRKVIAKKRADRAKGGKGDSSSSEFKGGDLLDHFLEVKHDDGSELTDEELVDIVRNFIVAVSFVFFYLILLVFFSNLTSSLSGKGHYSSDSVVGLLAPRSGT